MRNHAWAAEGAIGDPSGGVSGGRRIYQDPISAIIGVGGALIGANASRSAAKTQADATKDASASELAMFEQNRKDYAPWREAGMGSLSQLVSGTQPGGEYMRDFSPADFQADPGYQFRQSEGQRMLEGSAAGRGGLLSGGTLKALAKYGQGLASDEYGNAYNRYNANLDRRFNRLSGVAGTGQTATRDVAQMGTQVAGDIGQNIVGAGNARASGYVGGANAITGAANNYLGYRQLQDLLKRPGGTGGVVTPSAGATWDPGGDGGYADYYYGG